MSPIAIDPEVMNGTPCFAGTRVPVQTLFKVLDLAGPRVASVAAADAA